MTGTVQIGEKEVIFCGNAATAIRYKQVFHRDLLMSIKGMSVEELDADIIKELAFIMACQSEGSDFKQTTFDDFISWLEQFEENDILSKSVDIMSLWMQNVKPLVKAKKK